MMSYNVVIFIYLLVVGEPCLFWNLKYLNRIVSEDICGFDRTKKKFKKKKHSCISNRSACVLAPSLLIVICFKRARPTYDPEQNNLIQCLVSNKFQSTFVNFDPTKEKTTHRRKRNSLLGKLLHGDPKQENERGKKGCYINTKKLKPENNNTYR